ncbi:MAG: hypothetical protein IJZ25_00100 [Lachnospiraceae bacterium]|nr:hypothetical protein [Lachnospiraceae bacterium]
MESPKNPKSLIIGLDLGVDTTQISVSIDGSEPESVSISPNKSMFLIPTVLCVRHDTRDWIFGDDAIRCRNRDAGVFVNGILEKVENGDRVNIMGAEFTGNQLLERFVRKIFTALRQRYLRDNIIKVIVTVRNKSNVLSKAIEDALGAVGFEADKVKILSYMESFMYYSVSQKKELWTNDVSLFDFDEEGLKYYQLSTSKKQLPITVTAIGHDFSDELNFTMLASMVDTRLANIFKSITDKLLYRQILSTIYFTGVGFDGSWADDVIKSLCPGRRVFKGQNLYAKGAAHCGLIESNPEYKDFLFLTDDQVRYSVSIRMFKDNRIGEYNLVAAGTNWDQVNAKTVGILDNTDEIFFTIYHTVKKETKHIVMNLRNIEQRENKTTRVSVGVRFLDRDTAVITIKDLGFGEFFDNSYRIWEKVIQY